MPAKSTARTASPSVKARTRAAKPAASTAKPARKGTARTSAGPASEVKTRRLTAAERKAGAATLSKPTPRKAAPKAAPKGKAAPKTTPASTEATRKDAIMVGKLRAKGISWTDISEQTEISLGRCARLRKFGKAEGIPGFSA